MSRLVGQLIERGRLECEATVGDDRAVLVSLTDDGRVVAERLAVQILADAAGAGRQEVSA